MQSYRFRLYPTERQIKVMSETVETCRQLYNDSLNERRTDWNVGFYEQKRLLTLRRQANKYYRQVHSQVLQDVLLRLDKAYQAFFKRISAYPKSKPREKYNSFTYPQYGGFRIKQNKLVLSFIGTVTFKMHRIPRGTMKRCTITRDVDQWYCIITTDDGVKKADTKVDLAKPVGIDVGLRRWLSLSDGQVIQNTLDFAVHASRIRRLQKEMFRKKDGSKNREKAKTRLAKAWQRIRRCRDDFVHKTSNALVKDGYTLIVFERLNITNMVKNHNLASAIMDAAWGKLREYTAYKVEKRGGHVILVNPNGTSQKCYRCGVVAKEKLDLSVRVFECRVCGLVTDRDFNAAKNNLKLGLEQACAEKQPILVKRISKFASRKQETRGSFRG